jgi:hypothetical protein
MKQPLLCVILLYLLASPIVVVVSDVLPAYEMQWIGPFDGNCEITYTIESTNDSGMSVYITSDQDYWFSYYSSCSCINMIECSNECAPEQDYYINIQTTNLLEDAYYTFDYTVECGDIITDLMVIIIALVVFGCIGCVCVLLIVVLCIVCLCSLRSPSVTPQIQISTEMNQMNSTEYIHNNNNKV